MNVLRKFLVGLGSLVVVALVLALAAPKTVRAVVSTLVTVSNTTSNPVPTADVYHSATQSVSLFCDFSLNTSCISLPPTGGPNVAYTVPAGQTLMVTDVEITTAGGGGNAQFGLDYNGCTPAPAVVCRAQLWTAPNDGDTHEFAFPTGIPFPAGAQLSIVGVISSIGVVRGYLTSN
jgi:hypothetical protein